MQQHDRLKKRMSHYIVAQVLDFLISFTAKLLCLKKLRYDNGKVVVCCMVAAMECLTHAVTVQNTAKTYHLLI